MSEEIKEVTELDEEEANQKPATSMRIAGGLIDICLIFLLTFIFHLAIINTPWGNVLKSYETELINIQDDYKLKTLVSGSEETYGHKSYEGSEEYESQTYINFVRHEDEGGKYIVVNNETISKEVAEAWKNSVLSDETYKVYAFNYRFTDFGILSLSCGVAELLIIFVIPLLNKKRSSLGRMFAGTMLVHNTYCTPAKWYQLLGRFFFVFLVESVLPYLFLSNWLIVILVPIILFIISLFNKNRRTIADFITKTRLIDKKTFQPITQRRGGRI